MEKKMLNFVEQMENYYGMPIDRILKEVKWDSAELDWGEPVGPEIMGEETLLADEHVSEQVFWVNKINSVFQDNIYISDAEAIAWINGLKSICSFAVRILWKWSAMLHVKH